MFFRLAAENVENVDNGILPVSYGSHPTIECASAAVDLRHDKQKGRNIVVSN